MRLATIDELTGWRNVPSDDCNGVVEWAIENFRIDTLVTELSGPFLGGYIWTTRDMDYLVVYENEEGDGYIYTTTGDYGEIAAILTDDLESTFR